MACGSGYNKMSDEVYQAIAHASSGFVEAPAGCGKTDAIVRTVGGYCDGRQLVLTHTHAGVDALRQRFRQHSVPTAKYHVDTIAGWSWGWVSKYPNNAGYQGSIEIAEWNNVYSGMSTLLEKRFVTRGILNSYTGLIVDEYQDCTVPMHELITKLKHLLPCRVLGDDLQGVFGFRDDPLIGWADVRAEFVNDLGALETPHRWIKAGNEPLGRWLLATRSVFRRNSEPDYRQSPIESRTVRYSDLGPELIRLTHARQGRICVISPKARPLPTGIETALVNHNYRVLEPNELSALRRLIIGLADGSPPEKAKEAEEFITRAYGGLPGDEKRFIGKLLKGEGQRPQRTDRRVLCQRHTAGTTPPLLFDLSEYIEGINGVRYKLWESISALRCVLEKHLESHSDLKHLYADEIAKRKYQSRSHIHRSIGSTLLVKGLEFDHAVILRSPNWQKNWGNYRDLYVALTRGSKSTTLIDLAA